MYIDHHVAIGELTNFSPPLSNTESHRGPDSIGIKSRTDTDIRNSKQTATATRR